MGRAASDGRVMRRRSHIRLSCAGLTLLLSPAGRICSKVRNHGRGEIPVGFDPIALNALMFAGALTGSDGGIVA